jgi:membrane fusion protein, multidrug efflux system
MRPVKVAQISEGQALIDSGLKPNETVVLEGQYRLESGSLVEELHGRRPAKRRRAGNWETQ